MLYERRLLYLHDKVAIIRPASLLLGRIWTYPWFTSTTITWLYARTIITSAYYVEMTTAIAIHRGFHIRVMIVSDRGKRPTCRDWEQNMNTHIRAERNNHSVPSCNEELQTSMPWPIEFFKWQDRPQMFRENRLWRSRKPHRREQSFNDIRFARYDAKIRHREQCAWSAMNMTGSGVKRRSTFWQNQLFDSSDAQSDEWTRKARRTV